MLWKYYLTFLFVLQTWLSLSFCYFLIHLSVFWFMFSNLLFSINCYCTCKSAYLFLFRDYLVFFSLDMDLVKELLVNLDEALLFDQFVSQAWLYFQCSFQFFLRKYENFDWMETFPPKLNNNRHNCCTPYLIILDLLNIQAEVVLSVICLAVSTFC